MKKVKKKGRPHTSYPFRRRRIKITIELGETNIQYLWRLQMLIQAHLNLNFKNKYEADFLFPTVSDTVLELERIKPPMALQI